ncbi:unnamed protein product [Rotaria socialis]
MHSLSGSSGNGSNQLYHRFGLVLVPNSSILYIADTYNRRIMTYLLNATSGSVAAGGGHGAGAGSNQLCYPYSFTWDSSSTSASSWMLADGVTGISGNTSIHLVNPLSRVLDPMGNMNVADINNRRIQIFLFDQSDGTTIAGVTNLSGTSSTRLTTPYWAILDDQLHLYVAGTFNSRVQKFKRY